MELKPIRTDGEPVRRDLPYEATADVLAAEQGRKVLRNTYLLLALTMVPTLLGAWIGMQTVGIVMASPIITSFVVLGVVIALQFGIAANRNSGLGVAFLMLMTGVLGWWLAPILTVALSMRNGLALVGYAAVGTGVIFAAMATLAATLKRDLNFLGNFLFAGMIALLVAWVAFMFLQIPALGLTIATIAVVIFSLFLVYDLQRIIRGGETNYIMAATGVYMSLWNIFANLLYLLLSLAGDRD